jgi:ribosomal protein L24E
MITHDEDLDRLYKRKVKCPYCGYPIEKFQSKCDKCGVTKYQISFASNTEAKQIMKNRTGEKIVKLRRRPRDISFTALALRLWLGGWFGLHNYFLGRKWRGLIQTIFISVFIATEVFLQTFGISAIVHDVFRMNGLPVPTSLMGAIAILIWFYDIIAIVVGGYRYPVRLGENKNGDKKFVLPQTIVETKAQE